MKRIIVIAVLIVVALSAAYSSFIPFRDSRNDGIYSSPSLAGEGEDSTPFGFELSLSSDISLLSFLSSPESVLDEAAISAVKELEKMDITWWKNNTEVLSVFSSFDAAFPYPQFQEGSEELEMWKLRSYLSSTFLSSSYTSGRRAYVVSALSGNSEIFPSGGGMGGEGDILLSFYGNYSSSSFLWGWNVNVGLDSYSKILGGGKGVFGVDLRFPLLYSFSPGERIRVGLSAVPLLRMETYILPQSFINARLQSDMISLFSDDFRFGWGLGINAGVSYRVSDELLFALDGRNLPSMRSYWGLPLSKMASFDLRAEKIHDTWMEVPDIAFSSLWKRGSHTLRLEMSDVVSQLLWERENEGYVFDYLLCPKIRYRYDISSDMALCGEIESGKIRFALFYSGFSFSLEYKGESNNIGLSVGYQV